MIPATLENARRRLLKDREAVGPAGVASTA
jgi:hypothetical protein